MDNITIIANVIALGVSAKSRGITTIGIVETYQLLKAYLLDRYKIDLSAWEQQPTSPEQRTKIRQQLSGTNAAQDFRLFELIHWFAGAMQLYDPSAVAAAGVDTSEIATIYNEQNRSVLRTASQAPIVKEYQHPQFSCFYPEYIQHAKPYVLMVFVHIDTAINKIRELAQGYAGLMGDSQKEATGRSYFRIPGGAELTIIPEIPGLTFSEPQQKVYWAGVMEPDPYKQVTFLFQAPSDPIPEITGQITIFQGPMILGEIPVQLKLVSQNTPDDLASEAQIRKLEPIFASYSHKDTNVMEYFRKLYNTLGQQMLVDIYDLRSGERWEERLYEWIDESAVFQLFWSENSAASPYCQKEWQHALKHTETRKRFIRPIYWKVPMPPPPDPLAHLHFQKVSIPD